MRPEGLKRARRRHTGLPPQVQCRAANLASRGPTWGLVAVRGDGQTATTSGTEPQPATSRERPCDTPNVSARGVGLAHRTPRSQEWKEAGLPRRETTDGSPGHQPGHWSDPGREALRTLRTSLAPAQSPGRLRGGAGERAGKGTRGRAVVERRWPLAEPLRSLLAVKFTAGVKVGHTPSRLQQACRSRGCGGWRLEKLNCCLGLEL